MPNGDREDYFTFRLEPELQNTAEIFRAAVSDLKQQLSLLITDLSSAIRQSSLLNMQTRAIMSQTQPFPPVTAQLPITQLMQQLQQTRMLEMAPARTLPMAMYQTIQTMIPAPVLLPPLIPTMGQVPPPVAEMTYSQVKDIARASLYYQVYRPTFGARAVARATQIGLMGLEFVPFAFTGLFTLPGLALLGASFLLPTPSRELSEIFAMREFIANVGMMVPRLSTIGGVGFTPEEITQLRRGLVEIQERFRGLPGAGRYGLGEISRVAFETLALTGGIRPTATIAEILSSVNRLTNVMYDLARRFDTTITEISRALIEIRRAVPGASLEDIGRALRAGQVMSMLPGVTMADVIQSIQRGGQLASILRVPVGTGLMLGQQIGTLRAALPFFAGVPFTPEFEQLIYGTFTYLPSRIALIAQQAGVRGDYLSLLMAGGAAFVRSPEAFLKFMSTSDLYLKNVNVLDAIEINRRLYEQFLRAINVEVNAENMAGLIRTLDPNITEEQARRIVAQFMYAPEMFSIAQTWAREQQRWKERAQQYRRAEIYSLGIVPLVSLFDPEAAAELAHEVNALTTQFNRWVTGLEKWITTGPIGRTVREAAEAIVTEIEYLARNREKALRRFVGPSLFDYQPLISRDVAKAISPHASITVRELFKDNIEKMNELVKQYHNIGLNVTANMAVSDVLRTWQRALRPVTPTELQKYAIREVIDRLSQQGAVTATQVFEELKRYDLFEGMNDLEIAARIKGYYAGIGEEVPVWFRKFEEDAPIKRALDEKEQDLRKKFGRHAEILMAFLPAKIREQLKDMPAVDKLLLFVAAEYISKKHISKKFEEATAEALQIPLEEAKRFLKQSVDVFNRLNKEAQEEIFKLLKHPGVTARLFPLWTPGFYAAVRELSAITYVSPTVAPTEKAKEAEKAPVHLSWTKLSENLNTAAEALKTLASSVDNVVKTGGFEKHG